jgi:uncharacterized protein YukE
MTDYDHYPEFSDDVETKLDDVKEKIEQGVQQVIDTFNDTVGSKGWMWLVSPAVKIAYEIAKDNLEDEIQRLWDEFERIVDDTWEKIDDLTGDPWELMEMNAAYMRAAGRIRDEKTVIGDLTSEVRKNWDGDAYWAYFNVTGEQTKAVAGVDGGLVRAATACAEGAQQIRSIWRDLIDAMIGVVNSILDAIKDGTDAGQWVTFDAGPAIKVIGKIITEALSLWNQLDRYFDENATVKVSMWRELNSGLDGLDANNDWPAISGRDATDLDDKGAWTQK